MPESIIGLYPPKPPACVEYDPRASEVARQIARIVTARLPDVTVEHVGSTAVPGCAGKGIVDLMLIYPNGQLEVVKQTLQSLGFQAQTNGHRHPETRPMRVGTFMHEGRMYRLHVHVIAASSPEVADLRAFRDRLRSDPDLASAYVARKMEILAAGVTNSAAYTHMKAAFIENALGSAQTSGGRARRQ